jgi:hypothetical protein
LAEEPATPDEVAALALAGGALAALALAAAAAAPEGAAALDGVDADVSDEGALPPSLDAAGALPPVSPAGLGALAGRLLLLRAMDGTPRRDSVCRLNALAAGWRRR